jgi:arylsulfatase A-like enzyme
MYEGGIRVPAFISWKGKIKKGSYSATPLMLMDLLPTFCELAGVDIPEETDGISFLPLILGDNQEFPERTLFWVRREGGYYGGQAYYAARKGDDKILQNSPYEPIQYFNLRKDPMETRALDPSGSKVYEELREELQKHIRKSGSIPWQE